jgi:exonuclease III
LPNQRPIVLINGYYPADRRNKETRDLFENTLLNIITSYHNQDYEFIICGDWNATINPSLDRSSEARTSILPESDVLDSILNQFSLIDSYREINPLIPGYTFRSCSNQHEARLDMFFHSAMIHSSIIKCSILDYNQSLTNSLDHKGVQYIYNLAPSPYQTKPDPKVNINWTKVQKIH